jgi:uncharacterized membrane protein HdeD (DUF308 family)
MMLMNSLLVLHILLGASVLVTLIVRYIAVLAKRIEPKAGRSLVEVLGAVLLASGVALVIVDKAPLTSACVSGLAIICFIVTAELSLGLAQKKLLNE